MNLPTDGREFCRYTVTTTDTLTNFEVQLTTDGPWLAATYAAGVVSLLVYGPAYNGGVAPTDGLGVLVAATCRPRVRCTDSPEMVVRQGDWIRLV